MKIETMLLGCKLTFDLIRYNLDVEPPLADKLLAYVGFPETTVLRQAKWLAGEWRDHQGEKFEQPPVCWYSLGTPNFGQA